MKNELITKDDLIEFRLQLIQDFRQIVEAKPIQQAQRWLKSNEVKQLLNVSAGTLQNLRINGTLTYSKIGGTIFYDSVTIEKILQTNSRNAKINLFSKL